MLPSLEEKEQKEQLISLIIEIKWHIPLYLESNQQKDHGFFHFHHKHGTPGQNRAHHFLNSLIDIENSVAKILINSTIPSSDFEIKLINEVRSFAAKTGEYRNYSGRINVHNNSCLSYILRALNEFYNNFGASIQSNILKEFAKHLSQRRQYITPTTIFSRGEDNETERLRVKTRLINLQDTTIDSW